MPKYVARVVHKDTGREEYLIREAAAEHEARASLEDAGLTIRSLRPADFGGRGPQFEVRTPKGRVGGPFGPDVLRAMVRDGLLTPHCSIRKTGDLDTHSWHPAWKIKGLFPRHVVDSIRKSHAVTPTDESETAKLKRLKRQLDEGLIDEDDYRYKKGELLGTPFDLAERSGLPAVQKPPAPFVSTAYVPPISRTPEKTKTSHASPRPLVFGAFLCVIAFAMLFVMLSDTGLSEDSGGITEPAKTADSRTARTPPRAAIARSNAHASTPSSTPAPMSPELDQRELATSFDRFVRSLRSAVSVTQPKFNEALKGSEVPSRWFLPFTEHGDYLLEFAGSDLVTTDSLMTPIVGEIIFRAKTTAYSYETRVPYAWERNYLYSIKLKPRTGEGGWDFVSRSIRPLPKPSSTYRSGDTKSFIEMDTVIFDRIITESLKVFAEAVRQSASN